MKHLSLLLLVLLLSIKGIAQTGSTDSSGHIQTAPNPHDTIPYATLYFYRSYIPKMNAPIKKVPIYINDSLMYQLKANKLIGFKILKEGKVKVAVDKEGETEIYTKVKFGNEYFFRCEIVKGLWFGKPTIEAVSIKEGKEETGVFKSE